MFCAADLASLADHFQQRPQRQCVFAAHQHFSGKFFFRNLLEHGDPAKISLHRAIPGSLGLIVAPGICTRAHGHWGHPNLGCCEGT